MSSETDAKLAKPALLSKNDLNLPLAFGYALTMSWVGLCFKSLSLYTKINGVKREPILDTVYLISIISLILCLILIYKFGKNFAKICDNRKLAFLIPLGVSISTALLARAESVSLLGNVCIWLGGIGSGIFSGAFLVLWGATCNRQNLKQNFVAFSVATIINSLIITAFGYVSIYLGELSFAVMTVLIPIVSYLFLLWGTQLIDSRDDGQSQVTQNAIEGQRYLHEDKPMLLRICVMMFIWGFLNELARTLYVKNGFSNAGTSGFASTAVFSSILLILLIGLAVLAAVKAPKNANMTYVYRIALITAVSSACLLPAVGIAGRAIALPYAFNTSSYNLFGLCILTITTTVRASNRGEYCSFFAQIRAAWTLGPIIGLLLGRFIAGLGYATNHTLLIYFAWIIACLYIFAYLFVFGEEKVKQLTDFMPPAPKSKQLHKRCEIIAKNCSLSEREREILIYLAKGRSAAFIQEQLVVSYSTVSTHRQHIYQKLGIHSQQELLDLVDKTEV